MPRLIPDHLRHSTGQAPGWQYWPRFRPADDQLPPAFVKALQEYQTLQAKHEQAVVEMQRLRQRELDAAAADADAAAAVKLVRAGKPIPEQGPAAAELATQRSTALRNVEALEAACETVYNELNTKRYALAGTDIMGRIAAARSEADEQIAAKAAELADLIDAKLRPLAVLEWLAGGLHSPHAAVDLRDVFEFRNVPRHYLDSSVMAVQVRPLLDVLARTVLVHPTLADPATVEPD